MKTIAIVATGGTIAGMGADGKATKYIAGKIDVDHILETIPMVKDIANIESHQLFSVDSNNIHINDWMTLSNTINEIVNQEHIDGVVVTHGTDTLDETAYYLTLTLHTSKPVVITGAMRPATATSADGPYNLYQAIALAASDEAHHQGVMGLFSNTIFSARDIQKISNYKVDAFDHRGFGCLGFMQDQDVSFYTRTFKIHTLASRFSEEPITSLPNVAIAYFYVGAPSDSLYHLAKTHKGIVIIGSGNGNYNDEWKKAILDLSQQGIIFVRSSRVNQGVVFKDNIFDPTNACIPANTLSGQKARVLLMLSLMQTNDKTEIENIFSKY